MKFYISFGFGHYHVVNNTVFDKDSICLIMASSEAIARKKAFKAFGDKWCFSYEEDKIKMEYFPRGVLPLERKTDEQIN